jgi:hypothetical protein
MLWNFTAAGLAKPLEDAAAAAKRKALLRFVLIAVLGLVCLFDRAEKRG